MATMSPSLIEETRSTEPDEMYISKLGYSLGRAIIRPDHDTSFSIEDRAPAACVADLIRHYSDIFPGVIAARRAEVDKPKPARRNTRPIDRRTSRSMRAFLIQTHRAIYCRLTRFRTRSHRR